MSDTEGLAREGRAGFHIALAGVFLFCFAPALSWWAVLRQPAPDPTGWRRRLVLLAVFDTLLVFGLLIGGARMLGKEPSAGSPAGARIGVGLEPSPRAGVATVSTVGTGSPAEAAGLRVGDQILAIDGKTVRANAEVSKEIGETPAGGTRHLHVRRGTEQLDLPVVPVTGLAHPAPTLPIFARAHVESKWKLSEILDDTKGYLATIGVLAILAAVAARRKVALRLVGMAMLGMAAPVAVMLAARLVVQRTVGESLGAALVTMIAGSLTMLAVAAPAARSGQSVGERLGTLRAAGLGLFYAFAGGIRAGAFALLISSLLHLPNHPALEVFGVSPAWGVGGVLLFVLAAGVVAPIAEECLFRGVLLPWLCQWTKPVTAVVVTAIAFGAGHLFYGTSVLVPFAYGLALGWARLRTGRLRASILIHVGVNLIATCLMLLAGTRP